MGFGESKMPTPEEMAKIQKERTLSDAELLKDGAEYVNSKNGPRLDVKYSQIDDAKDEMIENKDNERRKKHFLRSMIIELKSQFNPDNLWQKMQELSPDSKVEFTKGSFDEVNAILRDKEFMSNFQKLSTILNNLKITQKEK